MRDLTEEELKVAPEGFDEYGFNRSGQVFFFNRKLGCAVIEGIDEVLNLSPSHYAFDECKPIKRKQLDITQHEWSDVIAEIETDSGHTLVIKSHGSWLSFDKDDVIAMARDRGVTAEDLK